MQFQINTAPVMQLASTVKIAAIPSDPNYYEDEKIELIYEQWENAITKKERLEIRNQYNELAKLLNARYNTKAYLLIR